ncbi:MAG: oxidoreductase [Sphingomonadaceae bacterium]|nr:oxidoreductase [Sphingomonadaceae bacterium]
MSQTLFSAVGGEAAMRTLAVHFYDKVFADPSLVRLFARPDEDHAGRLAAWFTELTGGPTLHSQTRGGFRTMAMSHFGLKISEAQRRQWIAYMREACVECGWPAAITDQFVGYLNTHSNFVVRESNTYPKVDLGRHRVL